MSSLWMNSSRSGVITPAMVASAAFDFVRRYSCKRRGASLHGNRAFARSRGGSVPILWRGATSRNVVAFCGNFVFSPSQCFPGIIWTVPFAILRIGLCVLCFTFVHCSSVTSQKRDPLFLRVGSCFMGIMSWPSCEVISMRMSSCAKSVRMASLSPQSPHVVVRRGWLDTPPMCALMPRVVSIY
jgi:hypothetical protein